MGGNGSGKTTLAMLLLGLYQPEQGSMWLNGMSVTSHNLQAYRQYFSAVFADFHLLSHLLLESDDKLNVRAQHYLRKLGLENKVRLSNGRFSTVALSSGQRKRLALICAYLEDRDVYLFDEWASDQDPLFKRVFYCELLPELRATGKTVIVISHDDAYFAVADRIVQLQDGCLKNHIRIT
ncbi:ABC transporter ATP-binding protein YojI [compost metagenome]